MGESDQGEEREESPVDIWSAVVMSHYPGHEPLELIELLILLDSQWFFT